MRLNLQSIFNKGLTGKNKKKNRKAQGLIPWASDLFSDPS